MTAEPKAQRRTISVRAAVVCLALGLVVSIAMAWRGAVFLGYSGARTLLIGSKDGARYVWASVDPAFDAERAHFAGYNDDAPAISLMDRLETNPWWRRTGVFDCEPEARQEAYGWPALCLYWWGRYEYDERALHAHGAINLTPNARASEQAYVVLPVLPLWRGLAIDTVFYGAILYALGPGLLTLRARRRMSAGRCPKCGHALLGEFEAGCAECGWGKSTVDRRP